MDIKKKDIRIFMDLCNNSNGILGFTMNRRYDMEPREIVDFILLYQERGLISCDDEYRLNITDKGKEVLNNILASMKQSPVKERSSYFEEQLLPFQIAINEPYIPNITFLEELRQKINMEGAMTETSKQECSRSDIAKAIDHPATDS